MVIKQNDLEFNLSVNNTAQCIGFSNKPKMVLKIPETVVIGNDNYTVTSIGEYAFANCKRLVKVIIPSSIHKINKFAFNMCINLKEVDCDSIYTNVCHGAFYRCYNLHKFSAHKISLMEEFAFAECRMLTHLDCIICNNLHGHNFANCKRLIGVICGDDIKIHRNAFFQCARMEWIEFTGDAWIAPEAFPFVSKRKIICLSQESNLIGLAYEGCEIVLWK